MFSTRKTIEGLRLRIVRLEEEAAAAVAALQESSTALSERLEAAETRIEALGQAHTHWTAEMASYADQIEGFLKRTRAERLRNEQAIRDLEKRNGRPAAASDPAFDGGGGLFS